MHMLVDVGRCITACSACTVMGQRAYQGGFVDVSPRVAQKIGETPHFGSRLSRGENDAEIYGRKDHR